MELGELLPQSSIALGVQAADRAAAIHTLVRLLAAGGRVADADALERDVLAREALGTTDVGHGTAVPHAKSAAVTAPCLAAVTLREPLPAAAGGDPVRLLFLLAVPPQSKDEHVRILAALAARLVEPGLCGRLLAAAAPQEFLRLLAPPAPATEAPPPTYRVLAVTACPVGIAHTFMARQALREKAREMGISLKVEAHGAAGVEDPLTPQEIAGAECIIIAADRAVDTDRFAGKPLFRVPVGEAVRHPEQLLHRALSATAPDYVPAAPGPFAAGLTLLARLRSLGHSLYSHLMSGITRMLPFVTGGGILIALSFLLTGVGGNALSTHDAGLTGLLYTVGQACFAVMYIVLAGFIASSIGDVPAFVPGAMGGYFAWTGMTVAPQEEWVSSGFWGALIAGFGAGLLLRALTWACSHLPKNLDQIKLTLIYPSVSLLVMALFMVFIINPPMGRFNEWIYAGLTSMHGGSRLVLCAVLGGLMAVDYGGPVNKAAYLFGTVALMNGQQDIMAAVMAGGMVPPIGIALACLFFPDRFTHAGKRTAPSNFVLGASFVTEGALPFALRDPLRVIPSGVAGSTLAGLLCQWLGCGIPAPHGGLFLLPVMSNPGGFLAALAAGSVLMAALLGVFKKPLSDQAATTPVSVIVNRPYYQARRSENK